MLRALQIFSLTTLVACGGPQKATPKGGSAPSCDRNALAPARVQARYDKVRDATVVRLTSPRRCFFGADTSLVVAGSFKGRQSSIAPEELTLGILSRARAFRLESCTSLSIEVNGVKTPLLAQRVPEIGSAGILREYVLGPIPLQTFMSLQGARLSRITACGVSHEIRADEHKALQELLRQLNVL